METADEPLTVDPETADDGNARRRHSWIGHPVCFKWRLPSRPCQSQEACRKKASCQSHTREWRSVLAAKQQKGAVHWTALFCKACPLWTCYYTVYFHATTLCISVLFPCIGEGGNVYWWSETYSTVLPFWSHFWTLWVHQNLATCCRKILLEGVVQWRQGFGKYTTSVCTLTQKKNLNILIIHHAEKSYVVLFWPSGETLPHLSTHKQEDWDHTIWTSSHCCEVTMEPPWDGLHRTDLSTISVGESIHPDDLRLFY